MQRRILLWAVAVFWCAASFGAAQAQARFDFDRAPGFLPKTVVPTHQLIELDLDPNKDDFAGVTTVTLRVREPVQRITLHAFELRASDARIEGSSGTRTLTVEPDPEHQTWNLRPSDGVGIAPGEYRVRITYQGRVHVAGEGLFRAHAQVAGREQAMLATQLEAIGARTVFPCFDEPAFRVAYQLTVRAPRAASVISNMPEMAEIPKMAEVAAELPKRSKKHRAPSGVEPTTPAAFAPTSATRLHLFAPTPPMPSYLVSVAVGGFDVLRGQAGRVPLRIFTAPGKREQARYALGATQQVVPYYEAYFGQPYALPKLDQLAVPSVRDGAMEDWGLISYNEADLLFDPKRSSQATQRGIFSVVAHEVAHQWFGDLVTAASWDEIWLNEAFATWMANRATQHFNPTWQVLFKRQLPKDRAMRRDSSASTRAIRSGAVSERATADVFDVITYEKGGAVLSMLEQWLGETTFQRGLAAYMSDRRLSNATAGDLWHHLGQAAGQDVAAVAASWTDQPGFPLIKVSSRCEAGVTRGALSQSRLGPGADALWKIPVALARGSERRTILLDQASGHWEWPGCSDQPVVVNAGGEGFYRVAYDADATQALSREFLRLAPADRVVLLSDRFALVQAGLAGPQGIADWLALLQQLSTVQGPDRATLFSLARSGFRTLDAALQESAAQDALRKLGRAVLAPELQRLGWAPKPGEDPEMVDLRAALIEQLAAFEDQQVLRQARQLFDADRAGRQRLAASIREAVVIATGVGADAAHFDQLLQDLRRANSEEERWGYAVALASGRDAARAQALLNATLNTAQPIAPANIRAEIAGLLARSSPFGRLAYTFTKENWVALAALTPANDSGPAQLLPAASAGFFDPKDAERLKADQALLAGADGARPAANAAADIALRAGLRERQSRAIVEAARSLR